MKKLKFFLFGCFSLAAAVAYAGNDRPIQADQLPAAAQQFIGRYFADRQILFAKMESEIMKRSYEVVFVDGSQIEFDGKGGWKEIDCKRSEMPSGVVPAAILQYVNAKYPDVRIVKIEKERREYDVKLSNRMELTFDSQFNLVDIDY